MKRHLLIFLSLFFVMVGWTIVFADDGFYVVAGQKAKFAPVPKTGQTTPWGTGDDGTLQKGVAWPDPRFTDNGNGTVTDKLTGLMWQKNANCIATYYPGFDNDSTPGDGEVTWPHALAFVVGINNGTYPLCGAGYNDWRLPNARELNSLIDYGRSPTFPAGTPFTGLTYGNYWSSTSVASGPTLWAFYLNFGDASLSNMSKTTPYYVWPVRGGK